MIFEENLKKYSHFVNLRVYAVAILIQIAEWSSQLARQSHYLEVAGAEPASATMAYKYKAIKVNGVKHDEHRYLMEQFIGRKLSRNEVVHHINGDKRDNRLENLVIMPRWKHSGLHHEGKPLSETSKDKIQRTNRANVFNMRHSNVTRDMIDFIRENVHKMKQKDMAEVLGISKYAVHRIVKNKAFAYIS